MPIAQRPPLWLQPPPLYAAEMVAVILHKEMAPTLTQVVQTALESLERVKQFEQQLQVLVIAQPPPLTLAFEEAMRSRGVSHVTTLRNVWLAAQWSGISKSRSLASRPSSRQLSPEPPPGAPSNIPTLPVVEPVTPGPVIQVEADWSYAVVASTPIPAPPHNLAAFALAQVPQAPAKPAGRAGWSGFSD